MTNESDTPDTPETRLDVQLTGWHQNAARSMAKLDLADGIEATALGELCMALRKGLTPEQQRTVAQDLLGEPHVSMIAGAKSGLADFPDVRILVPWSSAERLCARFRIWVTRDPSDPWWDK